MRNITHFGRRNRGHQASDYTDGTRRTSHCPLQYQLTCQLRGDHHQYGSTNSTATRYAFANLPPVMSASGSYVQIKCMLHLAINVHLETAPKRTEEHFLDLDHLSGGVMSQVASHVSGQGPGSFERKKL